MARAIDSLVDGIILAVEDKLNKANFDKTVQCRIIEIYGNGKYKVQRNNKEYIAKSSFTYNINDVVLVSLPQNDWANAVIVYPQNGVSGGTGGETGGGTGEVGDINNAQVIFAEASSRTNLASGETVATLFGKIKKFFKDIKTVAFTGSYNDLLDKPTIPSTANEVGADSKGSATTALSDSKIYTDDKLSQHNSSHAPANAQENVIEGIKLNGISVTPIDKIVDLQITGGGTGVDGGDADTLDGKHASDFANAITGAPVMDLNACLDVGLYIYNGWSDIVLNKPTNAINMWGTLIVSRYGDAVIIQSLISEYGKYWTRKKESGVWGDWVYKEGGTSTGVPTDADTVDGKHANDFVQYLGLKDAEFLNDYTYQVAYVASIAQGITIGLPNADWYHIQYFRHINTDGYGTQIAISYYDTGSYMYVRGAIPTGWGEWKEVGTGGGGALDTSSFAFIDESVETVEEIVTVDGMNVNKFVYMNEDFEIKTDAELGLNADMLEGKTANQFVQVDNVVNNFVTTSEGYVADARALKTLMDDVDLVRTETGVFTPTIGGATTDGVFAFSNCVGNYLRIGKLVFISVSMRIISAYGSTGALKIGGLPFTPNGTYTVQTTSLVGITYPSGYTWVGGCTIQDTPAVYIQFKGSAKTDVNMEMSHITTYPCDIGFTTIFLID